MEFPYFLKIYTDRQKYSKVIMGKMRDDLKMIKKISCVGDTCKEQHIISLAILSRRNHMFSPGIRDKIPVIQLKFCNNKFMKCLYMQNKAYYYLL